MTSDEDNAADGLFQQPANFMLIETCRMNPSEVFCKLYAQPYPFFLDSCGANRYSFAGANPFIVIKAHHDKVEIIEQSLKRIKIVKNDLFSTLTSLLNEFKIGKRPLPVPFQGGAVGYCGYDLKNQIEMLPRKKAVEPIIPDCVLGFYDTIFVYDHKTNMGYIVSSGLPEKADKAQKLLAKENINRFFDIMKSPPLNPFGKGALVGMNEEFGIIPPFFRVEQNTRRNSALSRVGQGKLWKRTTSLPGRIPAPMEHRGGGLHSNFTKDGYVHAIKQAHEYIASGDIYQVNLSQRFTMEFNTDPLLLYSKVRMINPVPFGAFLNYGAFQIISNSPERLLKVRNGIAETNPIKGTRPRGKNPKEDRILIEELKTSTKEAAEHIMIVDLERNDLGKICEYRSIKVWPLQKIETYATLHHMVSTVKGKIRDTMGPVDCIRSFLPGGSVTGAPKIRAMEIIEEIEPTPRGVYTGGIGYIDFSGNLDLSMAIRTAILKDKQLYLSVGGGIVADSNPEEEYEETILKANAFFRAMGVRQKTG